MGDFKKRLHLDSTIDTFFEEYILDLNNKKERFDYLRLNPIPIHNSSQQRLKNAQ